VVGYMRSNNQVARVNGIKRTEIQANFHLNN